MRLGRRFLLAAGALAVVEASHSASAQQAAPANASATASGIAESADSVRRHAVTLSGTTPVATVRDAIVGSEAVEITFSATRGQVIFADLLSMSSAVSITVWPPSARTTPLFRGDAEGTHFTAIALVAGDYTVRVHLGHAAVRRNSKRAFAVVLGRSAGPVGPTKANSARTGSSIFHETAFIRCQLSRTASLMQCPVGVIRGSAGNAEVHVMTADGDRRVLRVTGASISSLDARGRVAATRAPNGWVVTLGEERFEVPFSVITGG